MPDTRHIRPLQWALLLSLSLHSLLPWQIWPAHEEYLAAGNNMAITLLRNARQNTSEDEPANKTTLQNEIASQAAVISRPGQGPSKQEKNQQAKTASPAEQNKSAPAPSQSDSHNQAQNTEQRDAIQNPQSELNSAVHITPGNQLPSYAQQVLLHIIDKASAGPRDGELAGQDGVEGGRGEVGLFTVQFFGPRASFLHGTTPRDFLIYCQHRSWL